MADCTLSDSRQYWLQYQTSLQPLQINLGSGELDHGPEHDRQKILTDS